MIVNESPCFADRLRTATRALHTRAERAGVMRQLLTGDIDAIAYCSLLVNLRAIYASLEKVLLHQVDDALIGPIVDPVLFRCRPIEADLAALHPDDWKDALVADATRAYVTRIEEVAQTQSERLVAHAYVRYLGDLNGGQLLKPIVRNALRLREDEGVGMYSFDVTDASTYAKRYRAVFDALPLTPAAADSIVDEACWAFAQHVAIFEEIAAPKR